MKSVTTKRLSVEQQEYKRIRGRSHAENNKVFDKLVLEEMKRKKVTSPTPADWVRFAKIVRISCRRCAGTGRFITRIENGQPRGPGGICFRCAGKGWQNDDDARRNYGADVNQVVRM